MKVSTLLFSVLLLPYLSKKKHLREKAVTKFWITPSTSTLSTRWFEMLTLNSTRFSQWNLPIHFFPQPYHWRGLWNIPSYRCCGKHYCITWVAEISRTDAHDRWLADVFQRRESCATSSRSPPKQRRTLIVTVSYFQKCSVTCHIDKTWEPNQQQFFYLEKKMKQWSQRKTVDLNNVFLFPCDAVPRFA